MIHHEYKTEDGKLELDPNWDYKKFYTKDIVKKCFLKKQGTQKERYYVQGNSIGTWTLNDIIIPFDLNISKKFIEARSDFRETFFVMHNNCSCPSVPSNVQKSIATIGPYGCIPYVTKLPGSEVFAFSLIESGNTYYYVPLAVAEHPPGTLMTAPIQAMGRYFKCNAKDYKEFSESIHDIHVTGLGLNNPCADDGITGLKISDGLLIYGNNPNNKRNYF